MRYVEETKYILTPTKIKSPIPETLSEAVDVLYDKGLALRVSRVFKEDKEYILCIREKDNVKGFYNKDTDSFLTMDEVWDDFKDKKLKEFIYK